MFPNTSALSAPQRGSATSSDANALAAFIVGHATRDYAPAKPEKNPTAVALGRLGGLKGGKARAKKLSAKERSEIAKKAATHQWNRKSD